jgi:hypothetical protein
LRDRAHMQGLAPDVVLKEMREEIAQRLRPVCNDWPAERFSHMVQRIAEITFKYDLGVIEFLYDRRETEALIAELNAARSRSETLRNRSAALLS